MDHDKDNFQFSNGGKGKEEGRGSCAPPYRTPPGASFRQYSMSYNQQQQQQQQAQQQQAQQQQQQHESAAAYQQHQSAIAAMGIANGMMMMCTNQRLLGE